MVCIRNREYLGGKDLKPVPWQVDCIRNREYLGEKDLITCALLSGLY